MAVITFVTAAVQHSVLQTTWAHMGAADTGLPEELSRYPNKSVQITSPAFGGATVVMQGSEDNITYFTLNDIKGNPVSTVANAHFDLVDVPYYIRPSTSGGGITTNVTVILTSRSFGR